MQEMFKKVDMWVKGVPIEQPQPRRIRSSLRMSARMSKSYSSSLSSSPRQTPQTNTPQVTQQTQQSTTPTPPPSKPVEKIVGNDAPPAQSGRGDLLAEIRVSFLKEI